MHRLKVRLQGHRVHFDPPQHVATLSIERESDGRVLEVMPASGEEVDADVAMLRRLPTSAPAATTEEEAVVPGIAPSYLTNVPLVGEIDLANLPTDYKRSSVSDVESFEFTPGERYRVTLVSEVILHAAVVAD